VSDPDPDLDPVLEYVRTRRRRRLGALLGLLVLGTLGGLLWLAGGIRGLTGGPYNLRVVQETRAVAPATLNGIDLRDLHAALVPRWWISAVGRSAGEAHAAVVAMDEALAGDATLAGLFAEIQPLVARDPLGNYAAILDGFRAWNEYLDEQGATWFVEPGTQRGAFFVKTYEVVADAEVEVGGGGRRVRAMRRVDGTNVVEGWTGHSGEAGLGAQVTLNRVIEGAADRIWPLLDPAGDESLDDPILRVFAPAVRAEAAASLDRADLAVLERTALVRRALLDVEVSQAERHRCTDYRFRLDWLGLSGASTARVVEQARRDKAHTACPGVTIEEAATLRDASATLSGTRGLEEAFGALVAHVALGTAIHEARHIADGAVGGDGERPPLLCPGCPPNYPEWGRWELSAYLASFGSERSGATSLLRACLFADQGSSSRHLAAMELLNESWALDGCRAGPPGGLAELARETEADLFGRSEVATVGTGWPDRLPVHFGLNRAGN